MTFESLLGYVDGKCGTERVVTLSGQEGDISSRAGRIQFKENTYAESVLPYKCRFVLYVDVGKTSNDTHYGIYLHFGELQLDKNETLSVSEFDNSSTIKWKLLLSPTLNDECADTGPPHSCAHFMTAYSREPGLEVIYGNSGSTKVSAERMILDYVILVGMLKRKFKICLRYVEYIMSKVSISQIKLRRQLKLLRSQNFAVTN